jgi:hypothetical protein
MAFVGSDRARALHPSLRRAWDLIAEGYEIEERRVERKNFSEYRLRPARKIELPPAFGAPDKKLPRSSDVPPQTGKRGVYRASRNLEVPDGVSHEAHSRVSLCRKLLTML